MKVKNYSVRHIIHLLLLAALSACDSRLSQPNVILLYSDDHRYNTIASLGNDDISTPNLDRLVENGVSFTRAHIMGGRSGALCIPSRAMLHTGRQVNRLEGIGNVIPSSHATLPETLREAGYRTFMTGKWHNDTQALARLYEDGENIFIGGMHFPNVGGHEAPWLNHYDSTGKFPDSLRWQDGRFSSTAYGDAAVNFIRDSEPDKPFFLYVAFTSPHDPRTPPEEFRYDPEKIPLPGNYLPEHPFNNGEMKVRDEKLLPWPRTEEAVRNELALYYGMISEQDAQVGRILDALDDKAIRENTIIIYAGDNGLAVGSHGLLGKQNLYDHSVRVPLIINAPTLNGGLRSDAFAYIIDIFPTVCDLLGIPVPTSVDGKSLVPVIRGDTSLRENVYYLYRDIQRGVRSSDNFKLLKYLVRGEERSQLFDLNSDPLETVDLAEEPLFREKLEQMEELLASEMRKYGDDLDPDQPYFGKPIPETRKTAMGNKVKSARIHYENPYSEAYPGNGDRTLADEKLGLPGERNYDWQGFQGDDLELIFEWDSVQSIQNIWLSFLNDQPAYIFLPGTISVEGSYDGKSYFRIHDFTTEIIPDDSVYVKEYSVRVYPKEIRFMKFHARNTGTCPDWHRGAGARAWLFADEILVN